MALKGKRGTQLKCLDVSRFPGLLGSGFLVGWSLWGSGYHGPDLLGLEGIEVWFPIVHVGFLAWLILS